MIEISLNFAIFGGLKIPKSKEFFFGKIRGLALLNVD